MINLPLKVKIEDEYTCFFPRFNTEEAKRYPDAFFEGQRKKTMRIPPLFFFEEESFKGGGYARAEFFETSDQDYKVCTR